MEYDIKLTHEDGDEEWGYAWQLAGERYSPVRNRVVYRRSIWGVDDALVAAEKYGVKVHPLMAKRDNDGEHMSMLCDFEYGTRKAMAVIYGDICMSLFAADDADIDFFADILFRYAPPLPDRQPPKPPENAIIVRFSYNTARGNTSQQRVIAAPKWADIKENYPTAARAELDSLLTAGPGGRIGHLGVLHGAPGTGKSTFIRALAREWQDKAYISYIVDTEAFFANPSYLLDMILRQAGGKWHVIVCEDAEDFLTREAKERVGQAMSRILNVGDGMLGQGLRVLILFTTNAKRNDLDDALVRKGRCFLNLDVPLFTRDQAKAWLTAHGASTEQIEAGLSEDGKQIARVPLADLYAITGEVPHDELDDIDGDVEMMMTDMDF